MVVAAGSGGHILPAAAFCQALADRGLPPSDIVFVSSSSKGLEKLIGPAVTIRILPCRRTPGGMLLLVLRAARLLWRDRPEILLGFGGYLTVPFLLLGRIFGSKTMVHEQNVRPGKANKFLSFFVHRIIVSFGRSTAFFGKENKKVFVARYPLRAALVPIDRREALDYFGLREGYFTVLVIGGSQGAHRLNQVVTGALRLNKNAGRMQVIHLSGSQDAAFVEDAYKTLGVKSKVFAFLPQMHYAYSVADLVVGRSGAGGVQELMRFGLPSILVPYPHAGHHQLDNAKVLAEKGAALILEEKLLTPELLSGLLDLFSDDMIRRKTMSVLARSLYDASEKATLVEAVFA